MGFDQKRTKRLLILLNIAAVLVAYQVYLSLCFAGNNRTDIVSANPPTEAEVALALLRKSETSIRGTEIGDNTQPSISDASLKPSSKEIVVQSEAAVAVAAPQKAERAKQPSVADALLHSNENNLAFNAMAPSKSDDPNLVIRTEAADAQKAQRDFEIITTPDPDLPTLAYFQKAFYSGFRNEGMVFTAFVMYAVDNNFAQILLPTIRWKDSFGTDRAIPHEKLFDVIHWNSLYPALPRFVSYPPVAHREFNISTKEWAISDPEQNATHPFVHGRYPRLMNKYKQ
jgi:hypothetical protein